MHQDTGLILAHQIGFCSKLVADLIALNGQKHVYGGGKEAIAYTNNEINITGTDKYQPTCIEVLKCTYSEHSVIQT